ncbi:MULTISPECIES: hypothetical protein [unclassified Crossiella]|uniref:hypothetical protein n=1 Tax=unclassified Crossiella TaxID=2620835 RepID=UPI001FFF8F0B|nr:MULTISPECIES: hypothetical protein [unclassified Crossiella]MCK2240989.1 hypothetical protein [Crossiella sp. S99.2]MCK2253867.1 hypothetical protein [Crossiella sp. S99.1]
MRYRRTAAHDPHHQLLDYISQLDAGWRQRVSAVMRSTLPGSRATGYWLRTATVEHEKAGTAGTLDLVVATENGLTHFQFLALPDGERWRLVTRTQTWALALLASVATETLPAGAGGQDGLLVQIAPLGATQEIELTPTGEPRPGESAALLGAARSEVLRIVVEPVDAGADEDELDRQRAERRLLITLAEAVHRGLAAG